MPDPIFLKAVLKALLLPPGGLLLLAAAGVLLLGRAPRIGRALVAGSIGLLLLLSIPIVSFTLLRWVDSSPPLDPQAAGTAQAIVVLGGGVRRHAPEYGGDTLSRLTLERVRYGARVAKLTGLPVLVSGGTNSGGVTEAKLMRDALEQEFGVPIRWAEDRSRTTHENAVFSASILHAAGVRRVVLVVHGFDVPRASAEFAAQGIEVIAAPTVLPARGAESLLDFLPSMAALQGSYYALYELLALVLRRASG